MLCHVINNTNSIRIGRRSTVFGGWKRGLHLGFYPRLNDKEMKGNVFIVLCQKKTKEIVRNLRLLHCSSHEMSFLVVGALPVSSRGQYLHAAEEWGSLQYLPPRLPGWSSFILIFSVWDDWWFWVLSVKTTMSETCLCWRTWSHFLKINQPFYSVLNRHVLFSRHLS